MALEFSFYFIVTALFIWNYADNWFADLVCLLLYKLYTKLYIFYSLLLEILNKTKLFHDFLLKYKWQSFLLI